jgi:hypothetical protein
MTVSHLIGGYEKIAEFSARGGLGGAENLTQPRHAITANACPGMRRTDDRLI